MSPTPNANVAGQQQTLAGSWFPGESNSRPTQTQRQKKRQTSKKSRLLIDGQSALSLGHDGGWNIQERFIQDQENKKKEYWGDKVDNKCDNIIRIVSKNIQGLGLRTGNPKEEELKTWIVNWNIDVIGVQEVNVNWGKCSSSNRFSERIRNPAWEYARYSVAYNLQDKKYRHQYGGCVSLSVNQVTHRVSGSGAYERGLGRWSWLLLKGKDNIQVRIITVYQPNKIVGVTNCESVYSQQRTFLLEKGIDQCPLEV